MSKTYDLLAMGRSSIDLYANDIGVPFVEIKKRIDVPGFKVNVFNILGAGDAFAAGAIYGYVQGWDWYKTVRLANACGAIVVTRHGCANFTPTMAEVEAFVAGQGGW